MQGKRQKNNAENVDAKLLPKKSYTDAIGATLMALLLLGLLAGFLWLFGLSGGRYVLSLVLIAAGAIVWGWWKLVSAKPLDADD